MHHSSWLFHVWVPIQFHVPHHAFHRIRQETHDKILNSINLMEQQRKRSLSTYFHKYQPSCKNKNKKNPRKSILWLSETSKAIDFGKVFSSIRPFYKEKQRETSCYSYEKTFTMQVNYQIQFILFVYISSYTKSIWTIGLPIWGISFKIWMLYGNSNNNGTTNTTILVIRNFL